MVGEANPMPLLSPTFSSREEFIVGQSQRAPVPYKQLDLWHTCDTVIVRHELFPCLRGANPRPIVGMLYMRTTPAPVGNRFPYYIQTIYSEFDVVTYLTDLIEAGACPYPTTPSLTP